MKLRTMRTAAAAAGVLASATIAATTLTTTAALAVPSPNGSSNVLALAGSDTIQDVDGVIAGKYASNATNNPAPADKAVNVPALSTTAKTVPGDSFCETRTYSSAPTAGQVQSPNGSSAGKAALKLSADNGDGCIDIARSSSGRGATDPSTFEYYSFARDAVSFIKFSGPAPLKLSLQQIRDVYSCAKTNYDQVGGSAGAIQRYLPQDGSGTRSFFINSVLGGADPTTVSSASCPAVQTFQENTGNTIPSGDRAKAIAPYSAAQYIAQANKVEGDVRAGAKIGTLGGKQAAFLNSSTGKYQANTTTYRDTTYVAARDVFHVLDVRSPSYTDALRFVGFDASGPGALCKGAFNSTITQYGFVPGVKGSTSQGICRLS